MVEYLYAVEIWIIIAMILIVLEVIDAGSLFFLPMSLAGLMIAGWLYVMENQILPITIVAVPEKWYLLILSWAIFGLCWAIVLTRLRRFGLFTNKKDEDVNPY
jgi:hypothetical protein